MLPVDCQAGQVNYLRGAVMKYQLCKPSALPSLFMVPQFGWISGKNCQVQCSLLFVAPVLL